MNNGLPKQCPSCGGMGCGSPCGYGDKVTIKTIQTKPAPDCHKCGGRTVEEIKTGSKYTCECAYPEDCPIKKGDYDND